MITVKNPEHRFRRLEIGLVAIGPVLTAGLGVIGFRGQQESGRIEVARHTREQTTSEAEDFVLTYFASTCSERTALSDFPLTQWMNWREDTILKIYKKEGRSNAHLPVRASDPPVVMGTTQERGGTPGQPDIEELRRKQEAADAAYSPRIGELMGEGYRLAYGEFTPATLAGPVKSSCLHGRMERENEIEPEIPTDIVKVTPASDNRVRVIVRVTSDTSGNDHVADEGSVYSLMLVRTDVGMRLKALTRMQETEPG